MCIRDSTKYEDQSSKYKHQSTTFNINGTMSTQPPAILALEDGRTFRGRSWASHGEVCGEIVFNTSMTGYQEILTDPSYAGQIVCMTYPLIGNYGVNEADVESRKAWVEGFVVREASRIVSNWRATESLDDYLKRNNIVGIEHIDTRALVRHIREKGAMRAGISTIETDPQALLDKILATPEMTNRELASSVTVEDRYEYASEESKIQNPESKMEYHIVAYDFGVKTNSLREFSKFGCRVTVVPADTSANDVMALKLSLIHISEPTRLLSISYAVF